LTITISRDCGTARRSYRIECPDDARFYTYPADSRETILIPGPEHRKKPERSVWLRLEDAILAAREGRYGLRLVGEDEEPRAIAAEVASDPLRRPQPEGRPMTRRQLLSAGAIGLASWAAGTAPVFASGTGDPRFPATIVAEVGGKPVRLSLTGTALRTKLRVRVYGVASYAPEGSRSRAPGPGGTGRPQATAPDLRADVDGATMAKAYRESIGRELPRPRLRVRTGDGGAAFRRGPGEEGRPRPADARPRRGARVAGQRPAGHGDRRRRVRPGGVGHVFRGEPPGVGAQGRSHLAHEVSLAVPPPSGTGGRRPAVRPSTPSANSTHEGLAAGRARTTTANRADPLRRRSREICRLRPGRSSRFADCRTDRPSGAGCRVPPGSRSASGSIRR